MRNSRWFTDCDVTFLRFKKEYKLQLFKKKVENGGERKRERKE
jgi:hypothetical protein